MQERCTRVSLVESIQDGLNLLVQIPSLVNVFGKVMDHPSADQGFVVVVLDVYVDHMYRVAA
jgi:hypothetical protein